MVHATSQKNLHRAPGKGAQGSSGSKGQHANGVPPISKIGQLNNPNSKRLLKAPMTSQQSKQISPTNNSFRADQWAISARVQNQPGFIINKAHIAQSPQLIPV